MTLGERIRSLRMEQNLSQESLADSLAVSRQSVSKWETDASVPDLEKLIKMSDLFGVSLDTLIRGVADKPQQNAAVHEVPNRKPQLQVRTIIGIVLLSMAFITFWIGLLLDGSLLFGLVFGAPLALCGVICLTVRWHPGLFCAWLLSLLGDTFMLSAMRCSWRRNLRDLYLYGFGWLDADWKWFDFAMMLLQIGWIVFLMVWLGKCLLPRIPPLKRKHRNWLCAGVLLFVLLHVGCLLYYRVMVLAVLMDWLRFVLLSVLITCAVSDRRRRKNTTS